MATICGRFRLKATLANTGADAPTYLINCYNSGGTFMFAVQFVWLNASSTRVLRVFGNTTSLLQMGSDYVLPDTNWHTIQFKAVLSATVGEAYLWVDGTQVVNVTGLAFTSTLAADKIGFIGDNWTGTAPTGSLWVDDIIIDDAVVPGIGWQIARQGVAGTPTDTSANWVLVTGANIQACLSQTPTDTTNVITNATASAVARTMVVSPFSAGQVTTDGQSAHGSGSIGSGDTINGVKTGITGKTSSTSSDSADSVRLRVPVGGTNVDTLLTAWPTSTAAYQQVYWSSIPTYANLNNCEVGVLRGATGTRTHTIQDMWVIVDYTPVTGTIYNNTATVALTTPAASSSNTYTLRPTVTAGVGTPGASLSDTMVMVNAITAALAAGNATPTPNLVIPESATGALTAGGAIGTPNLAIPESVTAALAAGGAAASDVYVVAALVTGALAAGGASATTQQVFVSTLTAAVSALGASVAPNLVIPLATSAALSAIGATAAAGLMLANSLTAALGGLGGTATYAGIVVADEAIVIWRNRGGF
jgi:hypothetical protein